MNRLFDDFFANLDIVQFVESYLVLQGKPFKYSNNGRDWMKDVLRYAAHVLPYSKSAKPMVVLKGRQCGMSTATSALMLYYMYACDHKTFGHFFPEVKQAQRYSGKAFIEMIEDSIIRGNLPKHFLNKKATQSLTQKDFHNSNTVYIEGTSADARRLRGMSLTGIPVYDEFATTTKEAYKVSLETAANTHFGFIDNNKQTPHIVFGTPESEGSQFEKIWESSDKKEFHLKCPHCGHYFSLFYDIISREEVFTNLKTGTLVTCLDKEGKGCQKVLDKLDPQVMLEGRWISTLTEADRMRNIESFGDTHTFAGFYVPQYLSGNIPREVIDEKRRTNSAREFFNEVLGKFYSSQEDVLTPQQVLELTTKRPDTGDWNLPPAVTDKKTFMGIDWGGRVSGEEDAGTGSYTVVTVLSLLPTGHLKLEHASQLSASTTEEKVKAVCELIKKFNCIKICADRGYGQAERERLEEIYGSRFTAVQWNANLKRVHTYSSDINLITSDKHVLHELFFDQLRQDKFCFPNSLSAEEQLTWLREHICNVEVINKEINGRVKKTYEKKKGRVTDGLASILYSYTAFQFHKTGGFATDDIGSLGSGSRGKSILGFSHVTSIGTRGRNTRTTQVTRSDRRRR